MTYQQLIDKTQDWLLSTKPWLTLDLTALTQDTLRKYFDRSALNDTYAKEVAKKSSAGSPIAYLQNDSDLIFSFHKSMVARHKGRLGYYRDSQSQKSFHVYSALSLGIIKYNKDKELAEQLA